MSPERYQRINSLTDAALDLHENERAGFLDRECAGDAELRERVEALLRAHSIPDPIMEKPILELLAQDIAAGPSSSDLAGKNIQQYLVVSRLGAGGAGEVWLAKDTRLARQVALKILSPMFAGDPWHVRRFQREARAASTLNHPNIVTIYEIGSTSGFDFIAQEFVHGQTLRELLANGALNLPAVLDIGSQVAAALAAAHGAGIVHRDIKPENIMMRGDGLVKVLDFGVARFVERSSAIHTGNSRNVSITRPGFVLGTIKYMSPEQARGLPVDARSDIFSLGIVLYELAAGNPPFQGQTPSDVVAAILTRDAPPIVDLAPTAPPAFEAILAKCLRKDPSERYASAQMLRLDLERLLRRLKSPNELTPSSDELLIERDRSTRRVVRAAAATTSRRWRLPLMAAGILALVVLGLWWFAVPRRGAATSFSSMTISRLIARGRVVDAAISPDGSHIAYIIDGAGGQSLWMRQLTNSREVQLLGSEDGQHTGLAFSSDGAYLYYRRSTPNGVNALYRVAARGGDYSRLHKNLGSAAAVSPDGRQFAYFRIDPVTSESALMVASEDGSGERTVAAHRRPRYFGRYGLAWSPDGRWIACFAGNASAYTERAFHLVKVRVADGAEQDLGSQQWLWGGSMAWPKSGGRIFVSATDQLDDAYQVWTVAVNTGETARVTNDLSNYSRLSATSDGKTILALQSQSSFELSVAPRGEADRAVQVSSGNVQSFNSLAWTPDGRIVYSALGGDHRNIWIMDASGANPKQLTYGPVNKQEVAVTRDGKFILYHALGVIWRVDADGSHPKQLTDGANDAHPESSFDGHSVIYASFDKWSPGIAGKPTLWMTSIDGGQPVQLSDIAASTPRLSPDGRYIACEYFPGMDPQLSPHYIAILNSRGGEPTKVFDDLPAGRSFVSWAPDGRAIEFSRTSDKVDNIWRIPLAGGASQPVTDFRASLIAGYAWSQDGQKLALARGTTTRDIVLINLSRK